MNPKPCPRLDCRHQSPPDALFCARCGRPINTDWISRDERIALAVSIGIVLAIGFFAYVVSHA